MSEDATIRAHASAELTATGRLPASGHVVLLAVRVAADVLRARPDTAAELDLARQRLVRQLAPAEAIAITRSGGHGLLLAASLRPPALDTMRAHARRLCGDIGKLAGTPHAPRVGSGPSSAAWTPRARRPRWPG